MYIYSWDSASPYIELCVDLHRVYGVCRYCFWIKSMRGDENCKFLCADSESDMLKIMAAIVQAKVCVCYFTRGSDS